MVDSRIAIGFLGAALLASVSCQAPAAPRRSFDTPVLRSKEFKQELRIEVIQEGQGPQAKTGDYVRLHYIVELESGKEIASNHKDKKPALAVVGRDGDLVLGLHLGLQGVRVGELRKIYVPPALGYRGQKGVGVPPDATLVFLVEITALTAK